MKKITFFLPIIIGIIVIGACNKDKPKELYITPQIPITSLDCDGQPSWFFSYDGNVSIDLRTENGNTLKSITTKNNEETYMGEYNPGTYHAYMYFTYTCNHPVYGLTPFYESKSINFQITTKGKKHKEIITYP